MSHILRNPYVGPRTFEEDDEAFFFGRTQEARQLSSMVISERLVLFYAQSGAGKSSLINTRLRPKLIAEDFQVLPLKRAARVGGQLPEGFEDVDNIFVFNLISSLESEEESGDQYTTTDFTTYWQQFHREHKEVDEFGDEKARVLIIDQFEEIVTTNLDRWQDREPFFRQLAAAMKADPLLWVVLTLREDHVAAIEPYARLMPGGMRKRFYMQRMKTNAAFNAITKPAEEVGRPFTSEAANLLVDNLRQLRTNNEEQDNTAALGEFIEPVQLQVVCLQLWQNLNSQPTPPTEITVADLQKFGDVDEALSQFYETAIATVLQETASSELDLRKWFEEKLITEAGTRGTVFQGPETTEGMDNEIVRLLADQFLLRAEPRAGGFWFEIVHDRFVEPILQANQAWRDRQSPLIRAAMDWEASGQPESKLLLGAQLQDAKTRIASAQQEPLITKYLAECDKLNKRLQDKELQQKRELELERKRANEQSRRVKISLIALGVSLFFLLIAIGATYSAINSAERAETNLTLAEKNAEIANTAKAEAIEALAEANEAEATASAAEAETNLALAEAEINLALAEANEAEANANAAEAEAALEELKISTDLANSLRLIDGVEKNLETDPQLALLLAIEAMNLRTDSEVETTLRSALSGSQLKRILPHKGNVETLTINDAGTLVAFGGKDDSYYIWSLHEEEGTPRRSDSDIVELEFVPNTDLLIVKNDENLVEIFDTSSNYQFYDPIIFIDDVEHVSVSADGHIATLMTETITIRPNYNYYDEVNIPAAASQLVFKPASQWVAVSSSEQTIDFWRWNIGTPSENPISISTSFNIQTLQFSPDGNWLLAKGSDDVQLWSTTTLTSSQPLTTTSAPIANVNTAVFSPDATQLVTSGAAGVQIWQLNNLEEPLLTLNDTNAPAWQLTFSHDGSMLAGSKGDGEDEDPTIYLWDTETWEEITRYQGHTEVVNELHFTPNDALLLTASDDTDVRFWLTKVENPQINLQEFSETPVDLALSPDKDLMAVTTTNLDFTPADINSYVYLYTLADFNKGETNKPQLIATLPFTTTILSTQFSPDGDHLLFNSFFVNEPIFEDTHLLFYDLATLLADPLSAEPINDIKLSGINITEPSLSADGELLAVSYVRLDEAVGEPIGSGIHLFENAPALFTTTEHDDFIANAITIETEWIIALDVHFSPDSDILTVSGISFDDGFEDSFSAQLWDVNQLLTGNDSATAEIARLRNLSLGANDIFGVETVTFNPEGNKVFTIKNGNTIAYYDVATLLDTTIEPKPFDTLPPLKSDITSITFSPDNQLIVSDVDGTIHIWETALDSEDNDDFVLNSQIYARAPSNISDIIFSEDNSVMISSALDGTVALRIMEFNKLRQVSCQFATRNLTLDEYAFYLNRTTDFSSTCPNVLPHISVIDAIISDGLIREILADLETDYQELGHETLNPTILRDLLVERSLAVGKEVAADGDSDEALAMLQYALVLSPTASITPTQIVAEQWLSSALQSTPEKAEELIEKAVALDPTVSNEASLYLLDELAWNYIREIELAEAVRIINRALALNPDLATEEQTAVFDAYQAICSQIQENTIDEGVLFACEQAVTFVFQQGEANDEAQQAVCRNANITSSEAVAVIVLPACEASLETAVATEDFYTLNELCSLADISPLTDLALPACQEAVSMVLQFEEGNATELQDICRNATSTDAVAAIVLPACEASMETTVANDDGFFLIALCNLDTVAGYETLAAEACAQLGSIPTIQLDAEQVGRVIGDIQTAYADEYWSFTASKDQTIAIKMNKYNSELDAIIELIDTQGEVLISDDQSGGNNNARIDTFTLPTSGTYYLRASGWTDTFGSYELILTIESDE